MPFFHVWFWMLLGLRLVVSWALFLPTMLSSSSFSLFEFHFLLYVFQWPIFFLRHIYEWMVRIFQQLGNFNNFRYFHIPLFSCFISLCYTRIFVFSCLCFVNCVVFHVWSESLCNHDSVSRSCLFIFSLMLSFLTWIVCFMFFGDLFFFFRHFYELSGHDISIARQICKSSIFQPLSFCLMFCFFVLH